MPRSQRRPPRARLPCVQGEGHVQEPGGPVENDERTAVFRAMAAVIAERGGGAVTLPEIAARAGISPRKLRSRHPDVESCFLAAFEWCSERGAAAMAEAYAGEHGWVEGVRS